MAKPDEAGLEAFDEARIEALRALRDLPTDHVEHPLEIYLRRRGVSIPQAANYFGVPERTLRHWITHWARPLGTAGLFADALGFKHVKEIFPLRPGVKDCRH